MRCKEYVVGILFNEYSTRDLAQILLISKKRGPKCVIGKWNGVGGKIEDFDKTSRHAMARETKEETNLDVPEDKWRVIFVLREQDYIVHFLWAQCGDVRATKQMTDEEICWFYARKLPYDIMSNLRWMIPYALDEEVRNQFAASLDISRKDN